MLSIGTLLGCGAYFNSCVTKDVVRFVKGDSVYSNMVREELNCIESERMDGIDQSEKIQQLIQQRKEKAK